MDNFNFHKVKAINPLVTHLSDKDSRHQQNDGQNNKKKEFNNELENEIDNLRKDRDTIVFSSEDINRINLVVNLVKKGFSIKETSDLTFLSVQEVATTINKDLKEYDLNLYNEALQCLKNTEFQRYRRR